MASNDTRKGNPNSFFHLVNFLGKPHRLKPPFLIRQRSERIRELGLCSFFYTINGGR